VEVPLVVKAPDDEVVVAHVREFFLVDGIVGEERGLVAMAVKGGSWVTIRLAWRATAWRNTSMESVKHVTMP